ncbi:MAG: porin family protein [Thiovulaceae bacterium]|nr:porin family protein [Sulfurimonadaceae bacterium]
MKLLIILSMLLVSIYANDTFERVLITKTTKKSNLKSIKHKLNLLKVRMFVQHIPSGYYVYSNILNNKEESRIILSRIKTTFPHAKIVTIEVPSKEPAKNAIQEQEENTLDNNIYETKTATKNKNNFFVNFGLAYTSTDGSTNDATASKLENTGIGYTLEGGYIYDENFLFSVAYQDASTSDITMVNYFTSANYNLNILSNLDIYGGVVLGMSSLELDSYSTSSASTAFLYGLQIGTSYSITDDINTFVAYQLLMAEHTINLPDAGSKIDFSSFHNLQIGVGYRF